MDVWHWDSLVFLLCYSSLTTVPAAYNHSAAIDGASRWNVFRYIEPPGMRSVLLMAILLRFIDSFTVFTGPFHLNAGGPRSSTTFLAMEQGGDVASYNFCPAVARSIIYFIIILTVSWAFKTAMAIHESDHNYSKKITDTIGRPDETLIKIQENTFIKTLITPTHLHFRLFFDKVDVSGIYRNIWKCI